MAYGRYRKRYRRRFGRRRARMFGKKKMSTLRRLKRQNRKFAPMLKDNPLQGRNKVVNLVFDDQWSTYVPINTPFVYVDHSFRCNQPEDPRVPHGTEGARGIPYWRTKYKNYQVLSSTITYKITPTYTSSATGQYTFSRVVAQTRMANTGFAATSDWEVNQFYPTVQTKFFPLYNHDDQNLRPLVFKQTYRFRDQNGRLEMPQVREWRQSASTGNQDQFELYLGWENKFNGASYSPTYVVDVRIVYKVLLSDRISIDATYPPSEVPVALAKDGEQETIVENKGLYQFIRSTAPANEESVAERISGIGAVPVEGCTGIGQDGCGGGEEAEECSLV